MELVNAAKTKSSVCRAVWQQEGIKLWQGSSSSSIWLPRNVPIDRGVMYVEEPAIIASAFRTREKEFKKCISVSHALEKGAIDLRSNVVRGESCSIFGRTCVKYSLKGHEGLTVICDALSPKQQIELAHHSLSESLAPPNRTNLHCHDISEEMEKVLQSSIWQCDGPKLDAYGSELYDRLAATAAGTTIEKIAHTKKKRKTGEDTSYIFRLPAGSTLSRVRWATLGYQYNWTERSYSAEQHVSFPSQLGELSIRLAELCDESIVPQAGIVNFYPEGQVMGGHVDDGEEAHENPVVSVSIGSPCIFLIGGRTKDEVPVALLLRSGDCVILGGKARLLYHGVCKVFVAAHGPPGYLMPSSATQHAEKGIHYAGCSDFLDLCHDGGSTCSCNCQRVGACEISRVLKVLACSRINLNLRQVYRSATIDVS